MSSVRTISTTDSQSLNLDCRNRRMVGYQGLSWRSRSQRQSGANWEQAPDRLAQGARQMRDRGVDRNNQIEVGHEGGSVGHVIDVTTEVGDGD